MALAGLLLKRKIARAALTADHVEDRVQRIEERIGSLKQLRAVQREESIARRLHAIERRIVDDARAARKVDTLSFKDRVLALSREKASV